MKQKSSEMTKRSNCIEILGCFSDDLMTVNTWTVSLVSLCESTVHMNFHLTFMSSLIITVLSSGLTGPHLFYYVFQHMERLEHLKTKPQANHSQQQRQLLRETNKSCTSTLRRRDKTCCWESHLGFALLAVDDLGWNNLGGSGLGTRAHTFGLGDNHLGDGSRCCDDGWFGPLNCLQALLTLRRNKEQQFT